MIAVIRIKGQVGINKKVEETLFRLRLRRKYSCIVIENSNEIELTKIKQLRDFVSYGEISKETHENLIKERGKKDKDGKLKPFFRLHPARGGINTKMHYPEGVLGENKEMDNLIRRML